MIETDIAIVGAGVAGLSCAAALRASGVDCVLLEASGRIGGRAFTGNPAALGGAAFDHGASWLHAADRNPLLPIARAAGETILDADGAWSRRVTIDGRPADDAALAAYDRAEARYEALVASAAARPGDASLADAVAAMDDDPWTATIETFEATLIAAADARDLSARDAHANALGGRNLNIAGGLGRFVARRLARECRLETPVTRIAWGGASEGGGVALDTPRGTLRARACVVTVSTGVLRAGGIAFDPPLPDSHRAALDGLPMGLLTKVAIAAAGEDRFGLPEQCSLQARVARRHDPAMFFMAWPFGAAHVVGFVGGATAWDLARAGAAATEAFARERLRAALGDVPWGGAVVTGWAEDRWHRGAYAYARPGHAGARAALAEPVGDGRLLFAGEAVATDGLAGTVGGAWISGQDAARRVGR